MRRWLNKLRGSRRAARGQTTAEYAIIVALVAVASISVILIFGDQIRALFAKPFRGRGSAQRSYFDLLRRLRKVKVPYERQRGRF